MSIEKCVSGNRSFNASSIGIIFSFSVSGEISLLPGLLLATPISMKKAPDRIQLLKGIYDEEMNRAMEEDRDRASFNVAPALRGYNNV